MSSRFGTPRAAPRSVLLGVAVGLLVGILTFAVAFGIVAMPFYALARISEGQQGLDRPLVRDTLVRWTLPVSLLVGIAAGAVVGRWYRRGGRLPDE